MVILCTKWHVYIKKEGKKERTRVSEKLSNGDRKQILLSVIALQTVGRDTSLMQI